LLIVILLLICTCAYIHERMPSLLDKYKTGCGTDRPPSRRRRREGSLTTACTAVPALLYPLQHGGHLLEVGTHR